MTDENCHDATARKEASEAKSLASESIMASRSLERLVQTQHASLNGRIDEMKGDFDTRLKDGMAIVERYNERNGQSANASEARLKGDMIEMSSRFKGDLIATETRITTAISKLEVALNAQANTYSNRFWDTASKIIAYLFGALVVVSLGYLALKRG